MRTLLALLIAVLLVAAAIPGFAQDKSAKAMGRARDLLAKLDTDRDGAVSKQEFDGEEWIFDRLDKNHDGKLDLKELANRQQAKAGDRVSSAFAEADRDKDGKLSLKEFISYTFAKGDTNKDGIISAADRPAAKVAPRLRERTRERARDGTELRKYDKDGDGALSKKEFAARQADVFKKLDANADGFLTREEFAKAAKAMVSGARASRPGAGGGPGPVLGRMDTDGDGRISPEEWKGRAELFKKLDLNADGYIDKKEMTRGALAVGAAAKRRLAAMDTDGDGRISRQEWKGRPAMFDQLDRNGDGYIDQTDRPNR
jgi:Ca2+-binding EF-hand superfamily protein